MTMCDLDLSDWKTRKEILNEIQADGTKCSDREFRRYVEEFNRLYDGKQNCRFIAHSSKGYKITEDRAEIVKSINDNDRRAYTMWKANSHVRKALGLKNQLSIFEIEE